MISKRNRKGQSVLEYSIMLGVALSVLLIMQGFVKRGFQGNLKDAADKMGEQFSAGGTALEQARTMEDDQTIVEEVNTDDTIADFIGSGDVTGTADKGVYSYSKRSGGTQVLETKMKTDSVNKEKARLSEYTTEEVANFSDPLSE